MMTTNLISQQYQMQLQIKPGQSIQGTYQTPADKSISHRALIFGAIAAGNTVIDNLLVSDDVERTQQALQALGIQIETRQHQTVVHGLAGFNFQPQHSLTRLNLGNSGTTARLLMGLLAKQPHTIQLSGDLSLNQRPMARVISPLTTMGMRAEYLADHGMLPLQILPTTQLRGIKYTLPVASAQLKSALILGALQADAPSHFRQPAVSRDHTEKMLWQFGGCSNLHVEGNLLTVSPLQRPLQAQHVVVPGDPSSAAFLISAALLLPGSQLLVENQSLNETRTGFLRLVQQLAPQAIEVSVSRDNTAGEPRGDILVKHAHQQLPAFQINGRLLGCLIDEIPILSLLATQCQGTTIIREATELRYKETDRLHVITTELTKLGAIIREQPDGLIIEGPTKLHASDDEATVSAHADHRIAMMLVIAAILSGQHFSIEGLDSIAISNPTFITDLQQLLRVESQWDQL